MKRVFISLLVLAMTSTAGAFQISVNGDKYSSEIIGANLTLGIWTDTIIRPGIGEGYFALVVDTSLGTIDYTSGIVVPPYDQDPGIHLEHSMSAAEAEFPLPSGEDGIFGAVVLTAVPSSIPAGATIFDWVIFHSDLPFGDAVIKLYVMDSYFETSYLADTVVIHTPEPMTIGLLGLGGLFLRRKK
jgi:hypothetical protein